MAIIIECSDFLERATDGERFLLDSLRTSPLSDDWTVFFQPHINGFKPDFVLANRYFGVIIIEVKDWNLDSPRYASSGQILGENGEWVTCNPAEQVKDYKNLIINECCVDTYRRLEEKHGKTAYGIIENVLFFHGASAEQAQEFCGTTDPYTKIIYDARVRAIQEGSFDKCGIYKLIHQSSKLDKELVNELIDELSAYLNPSIYSVERRMPIPLNARQREYSRPTQSSHRRLTGVAGSGKTLVIASKAANLIAEGKNVLVLTYNITLMNLIKDLIKQQYNEPGNDYKLLKKQLVVRHFHGFLDLIRKSMGIKHRKIEKFSLLHDIFCDYIISLQDLPFRFDAVLIDEGQDFKEIWVKTALKFLNATNDDFLIVYDSVQDIYAMKAHVWIERNTRGFGFSGPVGRLPESYRLPREMAILLNRFCKLYGLDNYIEIDNPKSKEDATQTSLFYDLAHKQVELQWINVSKQDLDYEAIRYAKQFRSADSVHPNDICIITFCEATGVRLVNCLKAEGYDCSHVYDMYNEIDETKKWKNRRKQKLQFYGNSGKIHCCSVHSFKGWESNYLLICLEDFNLSDSLATRASFLYVALSRLKYSSISTSRCVVINCATDFNALQDLFYSYNQK